MLPVQVKVISSSPCTVGDASALLDRFLSSDACSDSFARDYVANLAQVFESRRSAKSARSKSGVGSSSVDDAEPRKRIPLVTQAPTHTCSAPPGLCLEVSNGMAPNPNASSPDTVSRRRQRKRKQSTSETGLLQPKSSGHPVDAEPKGWKQSPLVDCKAPPGVPHESIFRKQSLSPANGMEATSPKTVSKRHRRNPKHCTIENGLFLLEQDPVGNYIDYHERHNDKKRIKEEAHEGYTRMHSSGFENQGIVEQGKAVDSQKIHDKKRKKIDEDSKTENREDAENITLAETLFVKDTLSAKKKSYMERIGASAVPSKAGNDGIEWAEKRKEADSDLLDLRGEDSSWEKDKVVEHGSTSTSALQRFPPGEGKKKKKWKKRKVENLTPFQ